MEDDDFPYTHLYITKERIIQRFHGLINFTPVLKYAPYRIKHNSSKHYWGIQDDIAVGSQVFLGQQRAYSNYDGISIYFMDKNGISDARFKGHCSVREYWQRNKETIKKKILDAEEEMTIERQRDGIYFAADHLEITTFRPSLLVHLIQRYKATRVLDPCAGWGDRSIACMATGVSYTGVDPNPRVHIGYKEILETLLPYVPKSNVTPSYEFIEAPFEDAVIVGTYDMVFTSPPYFDYEEYSDDPDQSTTRHPTLDGWFNNFLLVLIHKAWSHLEVNGHMILNINDQRDIKYIEKMIDYINLNLRDSIYLGCLPYGEEKNLNKLQPIWIWRKVEPIVDFNPPVVFEPINVSGKELYIAREDLLPGGTYQRGVYRILSEISEENIIFTCGPHCPLQNAVAVCARALGKKLKVYTNHYSNANSSAKRHGAIYRILNRPLTEIEDTMSARVEKMNTGRDNEEEVHVTPGEGKYIHLSSSERRFQTVTHQALVDVLPEDENEFKRVWVHHSMRSIIRDIYYDLPVITVNTANNNGKDVGGKVFECQDSQYKTARVLPPYPSNVVNEAKMWTFLLKYAKEGDLIWNSSA